MLIITDSNFHQAISQSKPIIIDFYANWCGPCRNFAPTYARWSQIYGYLADFAKCDVDANQNVAANFRIGSLPTFVVLRNGQETRRWVGAPRENEVVSAIS